MSTEQQQQQPHRRDFHARITATGAIAISGMDKRKPEKETVMNFRRWMMFARFINGSGFRTFVENNREKLLLNQYEKDFLEGYLNQENRNQ